MALPGQTLRTVQGDIASVGAEGTPVVIGAGKAGSSALVNTVYSFAQPSAVESTLGLCPTTLVAQEILARRGGSVDVVISSGSIPALIEHQVSTSVAGTWAISGTPAIECDVKAVVTVAGQASANPATSAQYKISFDGGNSYIANQRLSGSNSYSDFGLVLSGSDAGAFVVGETLVARCHPWTMSAANLSPAVDAYLSSSRTPTRLYIANEPLSASAAADLVASVDTCLTRAESKGKFFWNAQLQAGGGREETPATVISELSDSVSSYGNNIKCYVERASKVVASPRLGYTKPQLPTLYCNAGRNAACLVSENDGWNQPVPGTTAPTYDEFIEGEVYNSQRLNALTTRPGLSGKFNVEPLLKCAETSDITLEPWGCVIQRAKAIIFAGQQGMINSTPRVLTDGTGRIDPRDAAAWEIKIQASLDAALVETQNQQGDKGQVSAVKYSIDQTTDVMTSHTVYSSCKIVPLAHVRSVDTTISMVMSLSTGETTTTTSAS